MNEIAGVETVPVPAGAPLPRSAATEARMADLRLWARPFQLDPMGEDGARLEAGCGDCAAVADGVEWPDGHVSLVMRDDWEHYAGTQLGGVEVRTFFSRGHMHRRMPELLEAVPNFPAKGEENPEEERWMEVGQVQRIGAGSDVSGTSGEGVVADFAVHVQTGTVVCRWRTEYATDETAGGVFEYQAIHGHGGATAFVWQSRRASERWAGVVAERLAVEAERARGERAAFLAQEAAARARREAEAEAARLRAEEEERERVLDRIAAGELAEDGSPLEP